MRRFEKVSGFEFVNLPKRHTAASAGYDFELAEAITIAPEETILAKTGIRAHFPKDEVLKIYIRSSIAYKMGVVMKNGVGVIDSDYYDCDNEGHILIMLSNTSNKTVKFDAGDRVAQGIFEKYLIVEDDDVDNARKGGFGSTNFF
jgi:dUTP pyrophosphatase